MVSLLHCSLVLSFFTLLSFPSDPPGWLVCCCATSAHSLQEMTNRVKDKGRCNDKSVLSASSTVWLTKAVDISVSLPAHVVVYTVPACPAPSRCVSLFVYNSSPYILCHGSSCAIPTLCILLGCWGLRKPPVLLAPTRGNHLYYSYQLELYVEGNHR